jgi:DNA-binding CsgD family transcriptional regulator
MSVPLTSRERQVAILVAQGGSNKSIADQLKISRHTVGRHLKNIFAKLHIHNRTSLVLYAVREGMVELACEPKLAKRLTQLAGVRYAAEQEAERSAGM